MRQCHLDAAFGRLERELSRLRIGGHGQLERGRVHSGDAEYRQEQHEHEPDHERGAALPAATRAGCRSMPLPRGAVCLTGGAVHDELPALRR